MSKYKKMKQLIADMRLPEYRYKQLLDAVFLQGIMRFEDMCKSGHAWYIQHGLS